MPGTKATVIPTKKAANIDPAIVIFTNSAPLGQVGLGVAMSVVLSVCLSVCAIKSQGSKGGPRGAKQSPIDPQIT